MTTTKVFEIFDILQDKYGAPYFAPLWKVDLFNQAQYEYLHDLLPEEGGDLVNFEFDQNITTNIQPLIWSVSLNMDTSGLVSNASLDAAIQTASNDSTATLFKILTIGISSNAKNYAAQYIKYNNLKTFQNNTFKSPKFPSNVRYSYTGNGIQFYPTFSSPAVSITVIKTPRSIAITPANVDPEWSDYVCYIIIAKMLKLAGVATNAEELINDVRASSIAQ